MLRLGRPVPAFVPANVSSGWSRPRGDQPHRALDIPVPVGTPVIAMADGVVLRAVTSADGDAGRWVGITHAGGVVTRYMHLSQVKVVPGQTVTKGQVIGASGNTGNSATPHVHVDVSVPQAELAQYVAAYGQPTVGWGGSQLQAPYGWKVPGEPLIPVDSYSERTRADAAAAHVSLYRPRSLSEAGGIGPVIAGAVVAGLVAWWFDRP